MKSQPATAETGPASLADYEWLVSHAADEWLAMAQAGGSSLPALVERLRKCGSAARGNLVYEQVGLRRRAEEKFLRAPQMFFTRRALEQASGELVAAHKAQRFAGCQQVFDLCAGIGGDTLALAAQARVVAVDRDPIMSLLASANSRAALPELMGDQVTTQSCDVTDVDIGAGDAWHLDPDRRVGGRRTTRVEFGEPNVAAIEQLLARNLQAGIKLAPAAELPPAWAERAELEWISRDRECRQLVAWFGKLASEPGRRRATVLASSGSARTIVGDAAGELPPVGPVGRYVFEPDAAVLAAKLETRLAGEHGLHALAAGIAYWTGDAPLADPALSCFEVLESLPFDLKRLKALLRARDIGRLEIKKRGVDMDPAELRRKLQPAGDASATLLVYGSRKQTCVIVARRVDRA